MSRGSCIVRDKSLYHKRDLAHSMAEWLENGMQLDLPLVAVFHKPIPKRHSIFQPEDSSEMVKHVTANSPQEGYVKLEMPPQFPNSLKFCNDRDSRCHRMVESSEAKSRSPTLHSSLETCPYDADGSVLIPLSLSPKAYHGSLGLLGFGPESHLGFAEISRLVH